MFWFNKGFWTKEVQPLVNERKFIFFVWMNAVVYINSCLARPWQRKYIYIFHNICWFNSSLQVVFLFSFIRLKTCKLILHTILLLPNFHSSKDRIVIVGLWFLPLNWTEMFYKTFPRPWIGRVSFFLVLLRKI